jgi:hypothetical protein
VFSNLCRNETLADDNALSDLGDFGSIHFGPDIGNGFFTVAPQRRTSSAFTADSPSKLMIFERWDVLPTNIGGNHDSKIVFRP